MSTTTSTIFSEIITKAYDGRLKLPAFQRKWKWSKSQVISLYESLRQGYPIGSFLFMTSEQAVKLSPRSFYGSNNKASANDTNDSLVLDGQQRITAGLCIYYGTQEAHGSEYYINVQKLMDILKEREIDIDNENEVAKFSKSIDVEDSYITAKSRRNDRISHYEQSKLLWTALLNDKQNDKFDELLDTITDPREKSILRKVIRKHFKAEFSTPVPVINLDKEFDLGAISKIFTTINTTGKLLTPFELVVAILYADNIKLEEEISLYREYYTYYKNIDKNGEVLLQTIALLGNKSPKKAELPRNITSYIYKQHSDSAVLMLEKMGEWLTNNLGVGLDVCNNLIPYDSIYAPLSIVFASVEKKSVVEQGIAKKKLEKWFCGAAISQRYQEGIHNKQSVDITDFSKWLDDDTKEPEWLKDVTLSGGIKRSSPSGALGKLFKCLINASNPSDPVIGESIGFKAKLVPTEIHHVFPTRWISKGLIGYNDDVKSDVMLNTMFLSRQTNADWLNFDPRNQMDRALQVIDKDGLIKLLSKQFITDKALEIMLKDKKTVQDYEDFLQERYKAFVDSLRQYKFKESIDMPTEDELEETVEIDT